MTSSRVIDLPGRITSTGWTLPRNLDEIDWVKCGKALKLADQAVAWWIGDWWVYGVEREYGDGAELAERIGFDYGALRTYGMVSRNFGLSRRLDNLSFGHHQSAM